MVITQKHVPKFVPLLNIDLYHVVANYVMVLQKGLGFDTVPTGSLEDIWSYAKNKIVLYIGDNDI